MDGETASEDEEDFHTCRWRRLKSGNIRITDSLVTKMIQWRPHEMVFTSQGQPPVFEELSLALFTNGYLCVLAGGLVINKALMQELMEDADMYGWRVVRDYHAAWLQKIEQGRAAWLGGGGY